MSFNPHPPLRASATWVMSMAWNGENMFQSSPAPEGECNLVVSRWRRG